MSKTAMESSEAPAPPAKYNTRWLQDRFTARWERTSLKELVFVTAIIVTLLLVCSNYLYRLSMGIFYYCLEYFRAAFGNDYVPDSCFLLRKESRPFWNLSNREYFRLRRCYGSEQGFERQGELIPGLKDLLASVLRPFAISPLVVSMKTLFR